LYQLQNAGHTKYITWSLIFTCSKISVEKLTNQAAYMEKELNDLHDSINAHRLEFHALNYFTTQQLLQIRRDLGNLKQGRAKGITPQLYSLLSSFSLDITSDDIKGIVEAICTIFNEQEANYEKQESINEMVEIQLPHVTETSVASEPEITESEYQLATDECMDERNSQNELKMLIENLSEHEEEIFEQLHRDLEFSEIVCYYAVKHAFSSNSDNVLGEAMRWCHKNYNQYENDDVPTISIAANENITNNIEEPTYKDPQLEMDETPPKEVIDIKHHVVQKLIQSNFTPELSIKGANMFNGNFEQAFKWCLKSENKDNELQQSSFVSFSSAIPMPQIDMTVDPVR